MEKKILSHIITQSFTYRKLQIYLSNMSIASSACYYTINTNNGLHKLKTKISKMRAGTLQPGLRNKVLTYSNRVVPGFLNTGHTD